jgi:hypothetical protein
MRPGAYSCGRAILVAVGLLAGCVAVDDEIEDLGPPDGKSDTALPRTVEVDVAPGATKRFRITTRAFVADLAQSGDVLAQLTAKHYEHEHASELSPTPHLAVPGDGKVRNWTLTVRNRGDSDLRATLIVDLPRAELGIVSDIDKTVLPPETASGLPPPYPGVATLYQILEHREGGLPGDMHYVTARVPDRIAGIPEWMALHALPPGPIDTGISTIPAVAEREKVADITRLLEARPGQQFLLFGDSSHRDPEVYRTIVERFPDRIAAVFIHKVNATVTPARVEGMHLVAHYAEAAAITFGLGLVTEREARVVIDAARAEGLALSDDDVEALFAR